MTSTGHVRSFSIFCGSVFAVAVFAFVPRAVARPDYAPNTFENVRLDDTSWLPRLHQLQAVRLPTLFDFAEQQGKLDNFRPVAGRLKGKKSPIYNAADSDAYKLIEGAAYALATRRDAALEQRLDTLIADIVAAQQPDSFLKPSSRFRSTSL